MPKGLTMISIRLDMRAEIRPDMFISAISTPGRLIRRATSLIMSTEKPSGPAGERNTKGAMPKSVPTWIGLSAGGSGGCAGAGPGGIAMSATVSRSQRPRGDARKVKVRLMSIPPRGIQEALAPLEKRHECLRPAERSQPATWGQGRRRALWSYESPRSARAVVAMPEIQIVFGVAADVLQLRFVHLPEALGGPAQAAPPCRYHLALRHERPRADLGAFLHHGAGEDHRPDADADVVHDGAGVDDAAMPDGDVGSHDAREFRRDVEHGVV